MGSSGRLPETDVIVVGSGAAGLAAAFTAAWKGAGVTLIERTGKFGGSTAMSAGAIWMPNNHLMRSGGFSDSRDEGLTYLRRLSLGQASEDLLEAFVDEGPSVISTLTAETMLRLKVRNFPDYHPEWPGAKTGGRSMEPLPFEGELLGRDLLSRIRRSPTYVPVMQSEAEEWGPASGWDMELVRQREADGVLTGGAALVAALLKGCIDKKVELIPNCRAVGLLKDGSTIAGVKASREGGGAERIEARRGVVLASGGYAWNDRLKRSFLRGPSVASASSPGDEGDGIVMGMEVGAGLRNMNEAWWSPVMLVPGELYDGRPFARIAVGVRTKPGSIMVNRTGMRFCNEAMNYHDLGKVLHEFDPRLYAYPNIPAYVVFDQRFRESYAVGPVEPGDDLPQWITKASTLGELAAKLGVDRKNLELTVSNFNANARKGLDPEWHRGESRYDSAEGDSTAEHPCLRALNLPPYYAVEIVPGDFGTKGGLATDGTSRVLDSRDKTIEHLYAAGNVAASVMGGGYAGGGATLGPALTFGFISGRGAAESD